MMSHPAVLPYCTLRPHSVPSWNTSVTRARNQMGAHVEVIVVNCFLLVRDTKYVLRAAQSAVITMMMIGSIRLWVSMGVRGADNAVV